MTDKIQRGFADNPKLTFVTPIEKGGTNASTPSEAVKNLGGISLSLIGVAKGLCPLNSSGVTPSQFIAPTENDGVTLKGPSQLVIDNYGEYTITNYDTMTTYTVSAASGSVSLSGDKITYTAPSIAGNFGFTVNGRVVNVLVILPSIIKPVIVLPVSGTDSLGFTVYVELADFSVSAGADTHYSTDWEVSTSPLFTTFFLKSYSDIFNKSSIGVSKLSSGTTYYVRARHKGVAYGYSVWSDVTSFSTGISFSPSVEEVSLIPLNTTDANLTCLTRCLSMDNAGSRIAVGYPYQSPSALVSAGAVTTFSRIGVGWNQETILTASDKEAGAVFGRAVSMSSAGDRIIVGAYLHDSGALVNSGQAYIYFKSGTTWAQQAILTASDRAVGDNYGWCVEMSPDGTRCAVTAIQKIKGTATSVGQVYVYLRTGTTWAQEAIIVYPGSGSGVSFGQSMCFDNTGTKLVISAPNEDIGINTNAGAVYTFTRSGTTWTQQNRLVQAIGRGSDRFGWGLSLSADGLRLAASSPYYNTADQAQLGSVSFYTWSGTAWVMDNYVVPNLKNSSVYTGYDIKMSANGDRLIAGAHGEDPQGVPNCGGAFVMVRTSTGIWVIDNYITASGKDISDSFGIGVTISGDGTRVAATATGQSATANKSSTLGQIYIFRE